MTVVHLDDWRPQVVDVAVDDEVYEEEPPLFPARVLIPTLVVVLLACLSPLFPNHHHSPCPAGTDGPQFLCALQQGDVP